MLLVHVPTDSWLKYMIFCRFHKINNFDYDCGAKRCAMKTQGHGGVGRSNRTPSISMFLCICSRRIVQKFLLEVHTHFCRYRDVVGDVGYGEDLNPKSFNLSPSPIKEFLVFVLEEILEYVNCFSFLYMLLRGEKLIHGAPWIRFHGGQSRVTNYW